MNEQGTVTAHADAGNEQEQQAAEAAAETATAGEAGDRQEEAAEKQQEPGKAKTDPGVQRKIDKLTRRTKTAEEEAAYWRGVAEGRKPEAARTAQPTETDGIQAAVLQEVGPKPDPNQYATTGEYAEAIADWKLRARDAETSIRRQAEATNERFQQTIKSGMEKYPDDFEEKLLDLKDSVGRLKPHLVEAISGSDVEADVLYYLGSNPDEAARINRMSPVAAAKEVARIEARLAGASAPVKKITTAPEPVRTLAGKSGGASRDIFDPTLSTEERIARFKSNRG